MAEIGLTVTAIVIAGLILVWVIYLFIGDLSGAPFVPVDDRVLEEILKRMKMKKGGNFWDLGSGNGKAVFMAVKKFGVNGKGVEINPLLVFYCRLKARFKKIRNIEFFRNNFYKTDLTDADYIYFYLFTGTVEKVAKKIERECKPGTIVASRAFEIMNWKNKLTDIWETNGWKTYFYKV